MAASVAGGVCVGAAVTSMVSADDVDPAHSLPWGWDHKGSYLFDGMLPIPTLNCFDRRSLRRGFEVYRQVCSTCHSLKLIRFRELVGLIYTPEQAKALAAAYEVEDGPNDEGEMFMRPGVLADAFPPVYANDKQAANVNGGAIPPDLSLISYARHGGEDYLFSLLTGYKEPPAGVILRDGLYFNPYFQGGALGMPPPLQMEGVEWEDGTPPTIAQQAKDVSTFLAWASEPKADERKKFGFQAVIICCFMAAGAGYYKRFKWSVIKNRKISYI